MNEQNENHCNYPPSVANFSWPMKGRSSEDWESRQVGMNLQKQDRVKLYRQEEMLKNLERQRY